MTRDAEVVSASGEAWVRFPTETDWLGAFREQALTAGDLLKTGDYGRMGILFEDGTQIRVSRRTVMAIKGVPGPGQKAPTILGIELGEVWSRAKAAPEGLRMETPSAAAAIRGTDWDLLVDEKGTSTVTVLQGSVSFYNEYGSLIVEQGQQATAEKGRPPVRTFLVRPRDRVQWVFSYPMNVAELVSFHSHRRGEVLGVLRGARERLREGPADARAKLFLAGLLFDAREWEESARLFDEVLAVEPENARALTFRGFLALQQKRPDLAEAFFQRALRSPQGDAGVEALVGRVGVFLERGEIGRAAALLEEIGRDGKPALAGVVTSVFQAFTGDYTKAVETASAYASLYPRDERFPLLLAGFLIVLDDQEQAGQMARKGLSLDPDSSPGYAVLAGLYHLQGVGREAESAYRKAIELDPANATARNGLAVLLMEKGYFEESGQQVSKAIEFAPDNPMLWANRGVLFTLIEKLEQARENYGRALEEDPTHYVTLSGLGLVALKEGRTEEAVRYFLKSSVLEPRFSQPHSFLAIAYYQLGRTPTAFQELALAKQLDPKDPFPHLIAYLIYQDTYRPREAIRESQKVLELLPYLRSAEEVQNTKVGLANLGSALLGFGLADWAESYAQESFDPYNASSHFQASRRYNDNHYVAVSELIQGLILDPLANSAPARRLDIIRRPFWSVTAAGTWADQDGGGGFSQQYGGIAQGYLRKPWETACSIAVQGYDREGVVDNGQSRGGTVALGLGIKPDENNSLNFGFTAFRDDSGDPGSPIEPDPDDELDSRDLSFDLGYRHRFGPKNSLMARAAYDRFEFEFKNPAPFGAGLSDIQSSFLLVGFGFDETRRFFQQGVYDVTEILGPPTVSLATDSTGTLAGIPEAHLLPGGFPSFVDTDLRSLDRSDQRTMALQGRHLFNLGDRHEITYGAEYIPVEIKRKRIVKEFGVAGVIDFYEDPILNPDVFAWTFPLFTSSQVTEQSTEEGRFITAYVDDRWKVADWLLLEGGLFFESFSDEHNEDVRYYPRMGMSVRLLEKHTLRLGYQHWLEKVTTGTLAPVAIAGLVVDNSLALQGSRLTDYQARLESRWTDYLFTVLGGERVELKDPSFGPDFLARELCSHRATAALNLIPWRQIGAFLRYAYTEAEGTRGVFDGLKVPGVPDHVASGGVVWISPWYLKFLVSETYVGRQFAAYSREEKLSGYWTTGLSASWEPFQKRGLVALSVNNLFNEGDPAPGRSAAITLELRF